MMAPKSNSLTLVLLVVGLFVCVNLVGAFKSKGGDKHLKAKDNDVCSDMPKNCCNKLDWSMLMNPEEYEKATGCKVKCCERVAQRDNNRQLARHRQGILSSLVSCVTELLLNITNFTFKIPKVCCQIPPVSLFPVCSGDAPDRKGKPQIGTMRKPQHDADLDEEED